MLRLLIKILSVKTYYLFSVLFILTGNYNKSQILFAQQQYELVDIEFTGEKVFSSSELESVISAQESPGWLSKAINSITTFQTNTIYFDSLLIPSDVEALRQFYMAHGYFKAKISSQYKLDNKTLEAYLTFNIDAGPAFRVRNVDIKGLKKIPVEFQKMIYSDLTLDSAALYSDKLVEVNKNFILNFLYDHGYMLAKASLPVVEIDTMLNTTDVKLEFLPGGRYKINNILVERTGEGKDLVDDDLIYEIADLKPGNYYSLYDLKKAQIRLYRTNLFTSALVSGVVSDTVDHFVPIKIAADVGFLHELSPELVLINEENTFKFGFSLSFMKKNFLGGARKFTTRISSAAQNIADFISNPSLTENNVFGYIDFRLGLEQPFILGKPIYTKLENYYTLQKKQNQYNTRLIGAELSLNFELPKYTYLTSLSGYLNIQASEYIFQTEYIKNVFSIFTDTLIINPLTSKSTNVLLGIHLGANKTDKYVFPTRGYILSLDLEDGNSLSYLFGQIGGYNMNAPLYYKVLLSSSVYLPVYANDENAFGIKIKTGFIHTYRGDKFSIPLNERFIAGGSNSVRAWKTNDLTPPLTTINQLPENITKEELESVLLKGITPGGFFLFESSIETRNRIYGNFGTALFIDVGNTWNSYKEFRFDGLAVAVGFGLRYYSSFAPIRIDLGVKAYDPFDRRPFGERINDYRGFWNTTSIQLGIGEAF